ncbi:MAG TPA: ribosome maturation factor RimP [Ideonella sp.]|uniref:ribosome maturation factor RimP n=1 Tax=Ideonella sp. TaxID=1929293 RepID=UPI002E2EECC1|nr:ribosome maturation factor RimP [Ideonella sp.]HEX5688278.1 ribosome maturation factor RimP [Ideonella sp.]
MSWSQAVEKTVTGLGYELVDVERSAGGLLRVYIDRVPGRAYPSGEHEFVTVEDCEAVTRQLQYVLEVDNVDYARLEVSSPGLDRPLKRVEDYARFAGQEVLITLKLPFQGRKKFQGTLHAATEGDNAGSGWQLIFNDGKVDQVLDFAFDEVREARLVPVLNFKGRRGKGAPASEQSAGETDGGQEQ